MNIVTYEEYIAEVIICDWCGHNVERIKTKHWVTGSRLCPACYKDAEDRRNKFMEEFRDEMTKGALFSRNAGW